MTLLKVSTETLQVIREQLIALHARIPLKLWMVTAVNGDDWDVVCAHNQGYPVKEGQTFPWKESFCCRMMLNEGPQFASNVADCEAYRNAPIGKKLPIRAYIGIPLYGEGHRFIGTLCGIDPTPDVVGIRAGEALVRQTAETIGRLLSMEHKLAHAESRVLQVEGHALRDEMTHLLNRRGWNKLLMETGTAQPDEVHSIVMVDLDNLKSLNDLSGHAAGDKLIIKTARVLSASMRGSDVVARLGGDEFGVLLQHIYPRQAQDIAARLTAEMAEAGVTATVGFASTPPQPSVAAAVEAADQMLVALKRNRAAL